MKEDSTSINGAASANRKLRVTPRRNSVQVAVLTWSLSLVLGSVCNAEPIELISLSTGQDAVPGETDPNWDLISAPPDVATGPAGVITRFVAGGAAWPNLSFIGTGGDWISSSDITSGAEELQKGQYAFDIRFTLDEGFDYFIDGTFFAADQLVVSVATLNGNVVVDCCPGDMNDPLDDFSRDILIDEPFFVVGENRLVFVLLHGGELIGTHRIGFGFIGSVFGEPVPTPATLWLAGPVLGWLGLSRSIHHQLARA